MTLRDASAGTAYPPIPHLLVTLSRPETARGIGRLLPAIGALRLVAGRVGAAPLLRVWGRGRRGLNLGQQTHIVQIHLVPLVIEDLVNVVDAVDTGLRHSQLKDQEVVDLVKKFPVILGGLCVDVHPQPDVYLVDKSVDDTATRGGNVIVRINVEV